MRRACLVMVLVAALIAVPRPAHAGFKSGFKKTFVKIGHVLENTVYVIAAVGAIVLVCSGGACGSQEQGR